MTVLNIKINCIALTCAQARLTMMFAMSHPDNHALHAAAWLAFERAKAHDDLAPRLASLRGGGRVAASVAAGSWRSRGSGYIAPR
jgi:hypothetical protein